MDMGNIGGLETVRKPIGKAEIDAAHVRLLRYKAGKKSLEARVIANQRWYQLRHWEYLRGKEKNQVEPTSAWLFNAIQNKHADMMDNMPDISYRPHEVGDVEEAQRLTSIVPAILERCKWDQTYSAVMDDKIISGTGVYFVHWDADASHGIGDVAVTPMDLLQIFWEPNKSDIQRSRDIFTVELVDNDLLKAQYPNLQLDYSNTGEVAQYISDESIDTSDKSAVIDWYYKKRTNGKDVLHYCKFCCGEVLFATENEEQYRDRGLYDHGFYPFVFDALYRNKGNPCGFGYVDIAKSVQEYIDRSNQAILQNLLANAKPRYFIRGDGNVNEDEFADMTSDFIHVQGQISDENIHPVQSTGLNGIYQTVLESKVGELKEVTGNRDVNTGGSVSGVTAASAIAAMQEAGSKLSRDIIRGSYSAVREVATLILELIRQFYDMPRQFRITGEDGTEQFVDYSNQGIAPQQQNAMGIDMGYRVPQFDIKVTVQKASPYTKVAQNELALQFYQIGFFNPQLADQSLAALNMMDFDGMDEVKKTIQANGTMWQQIQQMQQQMAMLAQMVDQSHGDNAVTSSLMQQFGMQEQQIQNAGEPVKLQGDEKPESSITANARKRVAESTQPRV